MLARRSVYDKQKAGNTQNCRQGRITYLLGLCKEYAQRLQRAAA